MTAFVTIKIRGLILNSVDSFLSLFQKTNENNIMEPHFLTKVYLESNVIGYDPSKEELKELLFESLGYITGTLEYLPDLEHKAYPDFYLISGEPGKDIHVALEDGLVDGIKAKLEDILELSTGVMKEYFKRYEKYNYLSNPSIISDIDRILTEKAISLSDLYLQKMMQDSAIHQKT
jgi:hypothetical protein